MATLTTDNERAAAELLKDLRDDPGNYTLLGLLGDVFRDAGDAPLARACRWCVAWRKRPHWSADPACLRGYWYFTHDDAGLHGAVGAEPEAARLPYAVFRAVKRVRAGAVRVRFPRARFGS